MEQFKSKIVVSCVYCPSMYKVASHLEGKWVTCTKCNKDFIVEAAGPSSGNSGNIDGSLLFCKIALNYGLVSETQLENVLTEYTNLNRLGIKQSIETLFVKKGFLTREQADRINQGIPQWGLRQKEKKYAAYAVEKGFLSKEKAKEVLVEQAKLFNATGTIKWVSEFLIESGELTREQHGQISSAMGIPVDPAGEQAGERAEEMAPPLPDSDFRQDEKPEKVELETPPEKTEPKADRIITPEAEQRVAVTEEEKRLMPNPVPDTSVEETIQPQAQPQSRADDSAPVDPPAAPIIEQPAPLSEEKPPNEKRDPVESEAVSEAAPLPLGEELVEQGEDQPDTSAPEGDDDGGQIVKKVNGLVLVISADRVTAILQAPDGILPNTTVESIKQILETEEISYGIVDDALIKGFLSSKVFREKPFKIAEGKAPEPGSEGVVKYYFDTDPLTVGAVSETGEIDFRDRGEIPYVKEGTLLAEITPPVFGKNGMDIYGCLLEVPVIDPIGLRCEDGAEFTEDLLKIVAKNDGQPKLTIDDRLYVLSELNIPGDVGFETGHIEFDGNIVITGTIQSDFTVRGANITANEVLAAKIIATGDLIVNNGITGADIEVEGNVKAKFINKGNIRAFGNVVAEREIIDSTVKNSGGCQVERGKIIASEISSKQGVEAVEIGTEMSVPSKFKIGVDDHINGEIDIIENQITLQMACKDEIDEKINQATEAEKKTHQIIAELAQLQDRTQLTVTSLKDNLDKLKESGRADDLAAVEGKIEELLQTIKKADNDVNDQFDEQDELVNYIAGQKELLSAAEETVAALEHTKKNLNDWIKKQKTIAYIKTSRAMYAGTTILGAHSSKVIKETIRGANIREIKNPDVAEGWEMKSV